jgi:hypothetical protein
MDDEPTEMAAATLEGARIHLGRPWSDPKAPDTGVEVGLPLGFLNRHGLIAGATGTGKTKTLQIFAGQLSALGVPVFAVDVKGDLSGIGAPGDATDQRTIDRCTSLAWTFQAAGHPLEILSLSGKTGAHVRASVSSFGPLLLGRCSTSTRPRPRSCRSSSAATTDLPRSTSPTCDDAEVPGLDDGARC